MGKLREIQSRILVYTMIIDMDDDNLGYEMDAVSYTHLTLPTILLV